MKIFLFLALAIVGVCSKKLPSYIKLCHRTDPKIGECISKAALSLQPKLGKGIPEMLIPPFDPLMISEAVLDGGANFKAHFKKLEIYNADHFSLANVYFDTKKLHFHGDIFFPSLTIKTQYTIKGKILLLQLNGHGPANGNFTNVKAHADIKFSLINKKGKQYMHSDKATLELDMDKPEMYFEGIIGDNAELNKQTNQVLNENANDLLEELKPVVKGVILETTLGIVNRMFEHFSFDDMFPA